MTYHPRIEPVPEPVWGENLRKYMTKYEWTKLRKAIISERGSKCDVCGVKVESRMHAHEEWEYDTTQSPAVARLKRIALNCFHCHAVEHFGWLTMMVKQGQLSQVAIEETIAHFCRLNKADMNAFRKHHQEAFKLWDERNELEWRIDWGDYTSLVGRPSA